MDFIKREMELLTMVVHEVEKYNEGGKSAAQEGGFCN